jgi:hypothetical protein
MNVDRGHHIVSMTPTNAKEITPHPQTNPIPQTRRIRSSYVSQPHDSFSKHEPTEPDNTDNLHLPSSLWL